MYIDALTLWEISRSHREEMLRAAAAARRANELPEQPSAVRATLSAWLRALARRIEPRTAGMAGIEPAAAHAR